MPDKPQASIGAISALPDHRLIELSGVSAIAFAQAQFMNDVAALGDDEWQWNGWLTPKGRVIALFALVRLDAQTLWLVLPDSDPEDLAARLQRFVFRSKVSIVVRDDLQVSGVFAPPASASGKRLSRDLSGGIELDMSAEGGVRCLRIAPGLPPDVGIAAADAAAADGVERDGVERDAVEGGDVEGRDLQTRDLEVGGAGSAVVETGDGGLAGVHGSGGFVARWMAADLAHGLPRLPPSQQEQWTPQQLSLDRLDGFSVKKGCYPGQEIVARTHFLGKAKRGLIRLGGASAVAIGSDVRAGDTVIGPIVCTAGDGREYVALAVAPLERHPTGALAVEGVPLVELPLLAGLAR